MLTLIKAQSIAIGFGVGKLSNISRLPSGVCNKTFLVEEETGQKVIIQEVNADFSPDHNKTIFDVATFLEKRNWIVPKPLKFKDGNYYYLSENKVFRAYNYIHGKTPNQNNPSVKNLAEKLQKLHFDLRNYPSCISTSIRGFHDSNGIIRKLKKVKLNNTHERNLKNDVLRFSAHFAEFDDDKQLIHGDTRYQNFLCREADSFITLIDFDTLMHGSIWIDISDFVRSYMCDENQENGRYNSKIIDEFLLGYKSLENKHKKIHKALSQICLELSARFLIDCKEDNYFQWDNSRYQSRAEHNYYRAKSQFIIASQTRGKYD